jgi:hypothetical protein
MHLGTNHSANHRQAPPSPDLAVPVGHQATHGAPPPTLLCLSHPCACQLVVGLWRDQPQEQARAWRPVAGALLLVSHPYGVPGHGEEGKRSSGN